MTMPSDIIERDNAALFSSDAAVDVVYRRPDAGQEKPMSAIVEKGDMASFPNLRKTEEVRRKQGRVFLLSESLADFSGGAPEYRDEIDIHGETWTVLQEISRDAGVIEAEIEKDLRTAF